MDKETLTRAVWCKARAKALTTEAALLKAEADQILPAMIAEDVNAFSNQLGQISTREQIRTNVNLNMFTEKLLIAGVPMTIIEQAREESTRTSNSISLVFTPAKDQG